mmetsp:Transcript_6744/g.10380  ORF Transcript_6744/g.10380 Transcript_6744/m.10380 type:complete len:231 (+) Transcript_6744:11221-11913(+)
MSLNSTKKVLPSSSRVYLSATAPWYDVTTVTGMSTLGTVRAGVLNDNKVSLGSCRLPVISPNTEPNKMEKPSNWYPYSGERFFNKMEPSRCLSPAGTQNWFVSRNSTELETSSTSGGGRYSHGTGMASSTIGTTVTLIVPIRVCGSSGARQMPVVSTPNSTPVVSKGLNNGQALLYACVPTMMVIFDLSCRFAISMYRVNPPDPGLSNPAAGTIPVTLTPMYSKSRACSV